MIWSILLLALLGVFADHLKGEEPSEFYLVSFVDHDVVGTWEYHILDVKQDGLDSLVRSILIGPVRSECPRRLTVRAAEARLHKSELAERASKAAQSWQFEPKSLDSDSITVAVDFRFRCP